MSIIATVMVVCLLISSLVFGIAAVICKIKEDEEKKKRS